MSEEKLQILMNGHIVRYLETRAPLMALQGARRAGKTFTIMQWLLLQAYNEGDVCLIIL